MPRGDGRPSGRIVGGETWCGSREAICLLDAFGTAPAIMDTLLRICVGFFAAVKKGLRHLQQGGGGHASKRRNAVCFALSVRIIT